MACCGKEGRRTAMWMFFAVNVLITSIYFVLCFFCFDKLMESSGEMSLDPTALFKNKIWLGLLAAVLFSGMLMLGFNLLSCVIIIKKSINKSGPGFGFGFMVAYSFTMAFFNLLTGLVMDSFKVTVTEVLEKESKSWTPMASNAYVACMGFAFLNFVWLLLYFVLLLALQGGFFEQLQGGMASLMRQKYGRMDESFAAQPIFSAPLNFGPGAPAGMMAPVPGMMPAMPGMMQPGMVPGTMPAGVPMAAMPVGPAPAK